MPTDRRERLLTIVSSANRAGDTVALAEAIHCAPVGVISRWERALLSAIPTVSAIDSLLIESRVAAGILDVVAFAAVLREIGWDEDAIESAERNVSTLPAWNGWGTPDERDSAIDQGVAA